MFEIQVFQQSSVRLAKGWACIEPITGHYKGGLSTDFEAAHL
jgi:hypothetical protein